MGDGKAKIQSLIYGSGSWFQRHSFVRIALIITAILFTIGSLIISDHLVKQMAHEEREKMEVWAHATQAIVSGSQEECLSLLSHIIETNETIPIILTDELGRICSFNNIELPRENPEKFLYEKLAEFRQVYPPIVINTRPVEYLYYSDSTFLKRLLLFPYVQLGVFIVVLAISILAIMTLKRADQNKIWEGLSRETAHQLGTPISSLIAWKELLKESNVDPMIPYEMEKDIRRLEIIANRFQKIGSLPQLNIENVKDVLTTAIAYMQPRISPSVSLELKPNSEGNLMFVRMSEILFAWVLENLIKNAVDAMAGKGQILVSYGQTSKEKLFIDIEDTGRGIYKSKFNLIFKPGYSTRKRGWGLGLSLAKRIIEDYHQGSIFVYKSEVGKGTTFRIVFPLVIEKNS